MYKQIITAETPEQLQSKILALAASLNGAEIKLEKAAGKTKTVKTEDVVKKEDELRPLAAYWPEETKDTKTEHEPVSTAVTSSEVDSRGMPWDERIHAATKSKNEDGSWRNRRGVDKDLVKQVEASLPRGVVEATPVSSAPVTSAPVQESSPTLPLSNVTVSPFAVASPQAPNTPPPVAAPMPVQVPSAFDFETFTAHLPAIASRLSAEGKITRDYVLQLEKHYGLSQFMDILKSENVDARLQIFNSWAQYGLIQKVG